MGLQWQLERIDRELAEARERAHRISRPLGPEAWGARPAVDQWSVAECLIHLNLTSRAFLPLLQGAVRQGRDLGRFGTGPYRRDLVGWLVHRLAEPPVRFRVRTTAPFVPAGIEPREAVLRDFDTLQARVAGCLAEADGLDLGRIRVPSPFAPRLRYNLYSALTIIPAHQRQHLAQAEEAVRRMSET